MVACCCCCCCACFFALPRKPKRKNDAADIFELVELVLEVLLEGDIAIKQSVSNI